MRPRPRPRRGSVSAGVATPDEIIGRYEAARERVIAAAEEAAARPQLRSAGGDHRPARAVPPGGGRRPGGPGRGGDGPQARSGCPGARWATRRRRAGPAGCPDAGCPCAREAAAGAQRAQPRLHDGPLAGVGRQHQAHGQRAVFHTVAERRRRDRRQRVSAILPSGGSVSRGPALRMRTGSADRQARWTRRDLQMVGVMRGERRGGTAPRQGTRRTSVAGDHQDPLRAGLAGHSETALPVNSVCAKVWLFRACTKMPEGEYRVTCGFQHTAGRGAQ